MSLQDHLQYCNQIYTAIIINYVGLLAAFPIALSYLRFRDPAEFQIAILFFKQQGRPKQVLRLAIRYGNPSSIIFKAAAIPRTRYLIGRENIQAIVSPGRLVGHRFRNSAK